MGIYTSCGIKEKQIGIISNYLNRSCFVHLRAGSLPPFVLKSDFHTILNLSVPFPIVYSAIERETEEDFVNTFCESLRSRLLLKNECGIVSADVQCSGTISFVLKRAAYVCDDLVPLSFNLDVCYVDGESVEEVKNGVIERVKDLFHQTMTMNYGSGCSLW